MKLVETVMKSVDQSSEVIKPKIKPNPQKIKTSCNRKAVTPNQSCETEAVKRFTVEEMREKRNVKRVLNPKQLMKWVEEFKEIIKQKSKFSRNKTPCKTPRCETKAEKRLKQWGRDAGGRGMKPVLLVVGPAGGHGVAVGGVAEGFELDEVGEGMDEQALEGVVLLVDVFVAVAGGAAEHGVGARADAADEEALVLGDGVDRQVLDADEDDGGVDGGQVGHEVREEGRHAVRQVRVHEADARHAHQPQAGPQPQQPPHRHLVLLLVLVPLQRPIVPHVHDRPEHRRDHQRHPPPLRRLEQHRRQIRPLDQPKPQEEPHSHHPVPPPHDHHHQRHQKRCHDHHHNHRNPCHTSPIALTLQPSISYTSSGFHHPAIESQGCEFCGRTYSALILIPVTSQLWQNPKPYVHRSLEDFYLSSDVAL